MAKTCAKHQGQWSVGSEDSVETDGRTNTTDRSIFPQFPVNAAGKSPSLATNSKISNCLTYRNVPIATGRRQIFLLLQRQYDDVIVTSTGIRDVILEHCPADHMMTSLSANHAEKKQLQFTRKSCEKQAKRHILMRLVA